MISTITFWPAHGRVDQLADLLVDLVRDFVAVVALLADLAAKEDELVLLAEGERAERSLIPNSVTMRRAIAVARSMSLAAPVDCSSKTMSSATCPAMKTGQLDPRTGSWS